MGEGITSQHRFQEVRWVVIYIKEKFPDLRSFRQQGPIGEYGASKSLAVCKIAMGRELVTDRAHVVSNIYVQHT